MPNGVKKNADYPVIEKSMALFEKAQTFMPPVTQTMAKGPGQYSLGACPVYLKRGKGSRVWDVDGNEYLDWNAAIGPLSFGYGYEPVDAAIRAQLEDGITFSLMHELEYEVAEMIREAIPNAESVRISKSGADVCSAAVRISRAFTGRTDLLCCGYHGWHDWYISVTSRANGIPESTRNHTYTFDYNNIDSLKAALTPNVAAVILEPFVFDKPDEGYLAEVLRICRENGTLLIFDEMWSGFRLSLGGAQEYFGVKPDLAVYSKAVANGMPIAFLTGRKDVMDGFNKDVFFFTTFGGEALSLAATKATLEQIKATNLPVVLAEKGTRLMEGYNRLVSSLNMESYTRCKGYPCRTTITLEPAVGNALVVKAYFQQEMIKRGILWQGNHNMMYMHTEEDIDYTLEVYSEVLPLVKKAIEENTAEMLLRGKPLEAVFRKVDNFNMKPSQAR
jgi:glutamate-1-semialdehyde 2,1-aminomutase